MKYFNIIDQDFQPYYELKKIDKFNFDLSSQILNLNLFEYQALSFDFYLELTSLKVHHFKKVKNFIFTNSTLVINF